MKQTLFRQIFILLALVCFTGQSGASVSASHMKHAANSYDVNAPVGGLAGAETEGPVTKHHPSASTAFSPATKCAAYHNHNHNVGAEGKAAPMQCHQPPGDTPDHSDCGDQCDCGTGHCSSIAVISAAVNLGYLPVKQNSSYQRSYAGTATTSPYKPPISR